MKKKILIPMMQAGAGHKIPALAVEEAIHRLYPGKYETHVSDFAKEAGAIWADKQILAGWDLCLKNHTLAKASYRVMEWLHPLSRAYVPVFFPGYIRKGIRFIEDFQPDIVYSTQYFCTQISAYARIWLKRDFPIIGQLTDPFEGYSWWSDKKADWLLTASEESKSILMEHGVPEDHIKIMPFPLDRKFFNVERKKEEILQELDLDPSKITLLATGGGHGIGKSVEYMKAVYLSGLPLNYIAVTGKNEQLKDELLELLEKHPRGTEMRVLGFVDNMNELLKACDVFLTKAGSNSTMEALVMERPIIFSHWVNYAEKTNVDFVLKNGYGWIADDKEQLLKILSNILKTDLLSKTAERLKDFDVPVGADEVARFVVETLENKN